MKAIRTLPVALFVTASALLLWSAFARSGQQQLSDSRSGRSWTRTLEDRTRRGTLEDQQQSVRGDTGKWSDTPRLQHAPPIQQKPERTPLDEWSDQLQQREFQVTGDDDNWLLFRTEQLDDNDRIWVESIERDGNTFTVVADQAIWQGNYRKNFTWHAQLGVNLGKLEPGNYEARWVLQPLEFNRFEDPGAPRDNWPKDARDADAEPTELKVTFAVVAAE